MTWNNQEVFLARQRLGTAGTIARVVNKPITEMATASGVLKPGQGVILKPVSNKLTAVAPTTADEVLQVQGVVLLRPNTIPDAADVLSYADGEVVEILVAGFIYVKTQVTGSGLNPYDLARPVVGAGAEEWVVYSPTSAEQRLKAIVFIHPTELDRTTFNDIDIDTQIVYLPDRGLDRAVNAGGTPIAN